MYYYDGSYIEKIFPYMEEDLRKSYWFDENMYSASSVNRTEIIKFLNIDYYGNNSITSNSGNQIVFRYAGALLLYAEALAALGTNDTKANELLNRIRHRAGASEASLQEKSCRMLYFGNDKEN